MTSSFAPDQLPSTLFTLEIDPTWPHLHLWKHPFGRKLSITFFDSESGITETTVAAYDDVRVLGRAEMYKTFMNTTNREIPMTFRFQAQGVGDIGDQDLASQNEVVLPCRFLDALKEPVYDESQQLSFAPPPLLMKFGSLFFARCVMLNGSPTWEPPFIPSSLLPLRATYPATFVIVRAKNPNLEYSFDGRYE